MVAFPIRGVLYSSVGLNRIVAVRVDVFRPMKGQLPSLAERHQHTQTDKHARIYRQVL